MQSGNSTSKISITLRNQVYRRDNLSCRCGTCLDGPQLQNTLCLHHADGDPDNNKPENLITMKRTCHTGYEARLRGLRRRYSEFATELDDKYPFHSQTHFSF